MNTAKESRDEGLRPAEARASAPAATRAGEEQTTMIKEKRASATVKGAKPKKKRASAMVKGAKPKKKRASATVKGAKPKKKRASATVKGAEAKGGSGPSRRRRPARHGRGATNLTGLGGDGATHSHIVARNAALFLGGRDLTGRSNEISLALSAETPEVTAFGDDYRQRLSNGLRDWELGQGGFFDSAASQVDELFENLLAASGVAGFYPKRAASYAGYEGVGILTAYESAAPLAEAVTVAATISGCGLLDRMILLETGETTRSALAASAALNSIDAGGSCVKLDAVFRVFTLSGSGNDPEISASLQHSGNDSTWLTLQTWATSSAGFENKARATATAASRYRRLAYYLASDEGGSPASASATFMIACGSPQH